MIKLRTTKKTIQNESANLWCTGYCELQHLLRAVDAFAYSAGTYGWACDYYYLTPYIVLSTGYSPVGKRLPYAIVREYEKKAETIWADYENFHDYESRKKAVADLIDEFVKAIQAHFDNNPLND